MTLFELFRWIVFYTIVGAFFYLPLYACMITDTDWGWDHKVLAGIVSYVLPAGVVAGVVALGWGICQFIGWSKTVVLW